MISKLVCFLIVWSFKFLIRCICIYEFESFMLKSKYKKKKKIGKYIFLYDRKIENYSSIVEGIFFFE